MARKEKLEGLDGWLILAIVIIFLLYTYGGSSEESYIQEPDYTQVELDSAIEESISINNTASIVLDNFSNMNYLHFGHMPITYSITYEECGAESETIEEAIQMIQNKTKDVVSFSEVEDSSVADLKIDCKPVGTYESGTQTLGEAFFFNEGNLITSAEVTFFVVGPSEFRNVEYCTSGFPRTEVHEILHVFGFDHNNYGVNIMKAANQAGSCAITQINKEYISCLRHIYSNGEIRTSCEDIKFTDPESMWEYGYGDCPDGWYDTTNSEESCCPEPDMYIDSDGYCA